MLTQEKKINTEIHALKLMENNGLKNWKIGWFKELKNWRVAGNCNHKLKLIKLQPTYVAKNSIEEITNTILHEIAHALTPNHGHNKFWKRKAIEIGCTGSRTYSSKVIK